MFFHVITYQTLNLTQQDIENITDIKGLENKYSIIEELDLSHNRIREIKGLEKFINLKVLNLNHNQITQIEGLDHLKKMQKLFLRNNKISEIGGLDKLTNIEHVDLSNNKNINEIPDPLNRLPALKIFKLLNCGLSKFSESTSKFFWMEQNYRYFSNYSLEDVKYYEKTHKRKAASNNQLYKQFVKWLLKTQSLMTEFRFTYRDIEKFEKETSNNVIWSGKLTNAFKKWLFDRKQKKKRLFCNHALKSNLNC